MTAQRAHTTPITPLRRGLSDLMADTEQRTRAYDALLGPAPTYDRVAALAGIFVNDPILGLSAPKFPDDPVKMGIELIATQTVIAKLLVARRYCQRRLAPGAPLHQAPVYRMVIKDVDAALQGERRIRNGQIALQRMKT